MRATAFSLALLLALSQSPVWAQTGGAQPPRDCNPNIEPCPVDGSPSSGGAAPFFGAEALALLANRKREREAQRGQQALWGLQLASADDGLAGILDHADAAHWAFWGSGLHTRMEGTASDLPYDGQVKAILAGVEVIAPAGHAAGLALGYGHATGDLRFESAHQRGNERLAVLYGVYLLDSSTSVDAAVSFSGTRVSRQVQLAQAQLHGQYAGHRSSGSINLSRVMEAGPVALTAHIGYLATQEQQPQYDETGSDGSATFGATIAARRLTLSQLSAALEAAYPLWQQGEIFGSLAYRYDLQRSAEDLIARGAHGDQDEFELGLGARHRFTGSLTLSANVTSIAGRSGYRNEGVQTTLRWES